MFQRAVEIPAAHLEQRSPTMLGLLSAFHFFPRQSYFPKAFGCKAMKNGTLFVDLGLTSQGSQQYF